MANKIVKITELDGKKVASKEETESLRGKIIVLNTNIDGAGESEIVKNLDIKEKGVYGIKFR